MLKEKARKAKPPVITTLDPDSPVVKAETLAQLRSLMSEAAVRQIYAAIVADLSKRTAAIETAMAARDAREIRRIGHAIKGGCSMAGATQAAALGALIENGGLSQNSPLRGMMVHKPC